MKNKLTIAFVSDAIYPYNKGGKEKRLFEISTRLAQSGNNVNIYCMKWWKGHEKVRIENGVHLHAISPLYQLYSGQRRSIKQAILFALACFKLITVDFDVIDVDHMPHLVLFTIKLVTLLKKKKLYVTWNEVWGRTYWVEYLGFMGNLAYFVERLSAKTPDEINSISKHTTKKLIRELKIKQKINTIPMGINLSLIENIKPSSNKSDVIFAGRLLSHKNVDYLITAIHLLKIKYPNIKCVIVGKGPEEHTLKKLVYQLQLHNNVIFYDFLENHNDLYALMKSSKVFAFPSTREGFGIVALEANASGIPVITTDHADNATKDLIKNDLNGQIIELNEVKLAENLFKYLSNYESPATYSKSIKSYDWELISRKLEEIYRL